MILKDEKKSRRSKEWKMPRKRQIPPRNEVVYLLVDRDGEPIIVTKSDKIAAQWSEAGFGDYREMRITASWPRVEDYGGSMTELVARNPALFSAVVSDLQLVIDASTLKSVMTCPTQYKLKYLDGWGGGGSVDADFGIYFAVATRRIGRSVSMASRNKKRHSLLYGRFWLRHKTRETDARGAALTRLYGIALHSEVQERQRQPCEVPVVSQGGQHPWPGA